MSNYEPNSKQCAKCLGTGLAFAYRYPDFPKMTTNPRNLPKVHGQIPNCKRNMNLTKADMVGGNQDFKQWKLTWVCPMCDFKETETVSHRMYRQLATIQPFTRLQEVGRN